MDRNATAVRTVDLGYEQMLVLESGLPTRISVIYGGIWLTERGRPDDVFATSGEEITLKSRGLAVIEGLRDTRVLVAESLEGRGKVAAQLERVRSTLAGIVCQAAAHVRGVVARAHAAV